MRFPVHNVTTYRTRSGNTVVRTFDVLNREATRAPQGQGTVTNTYDLAGRLTKSSKPVVSGDPSTGDFEFFFDSAGRFYKEKYPDGKIVEHQLDANGNFVRTTWPDSYYIERAFDELNRLTGIKLNGAGTNAVTIGWDPLSRRTSMSYANGVSTSYTHQLDDDLASIVHTFVGSNVTFTLGHDKDHRMTSQQVSDSQYLWHPAAAGTTTFGTANNMNQYPTVGGVSYSYNTNGCLTSDGTWTWTYDTENHMTAASKTGTSITNYWDPVHRQREHKVGSTRNRYIYAGQQRIADYSNTTLQNRYVYGTGLDEVLIKVSSAGVLTYYSHDHEGSVVALTNSSGTVTNRYKYSPWGESPSMTGTTHGYTGQRFESESGLYYYKNRYYSPKLGRFLQPDMGYFDGLNLYTYVDNDPLNTVDPLGLAGQSKWGTFTPVGYDSHGNPIQTLSHMSLKGSFEGAAMLGANKAWSGVAREIRAILNSGKTWSTWFSAATGGGGSGGSGSGSGGSGGGSGKYSRNFENSSSREYTNANWYEANPKNTEVINNQKMHFAQNPKVRDGMGVINRPNADAQRAANLKESGIPSSSAYDRDEVIPAMMRPMGKNSVFPTNSSQNRSEGQNLLQQTRHLPNGTVVEIRRPK